MTDQEAKLEALTRGSDVAFEKLKETCRELRAVCERANAVCDRIRRKHESTAAEGGEA